MSERELPVGSGARVGANGTALAARRAEAWRLRVDEGLTYAEIGDRLGCADSTACSYVQHVLAEHAPTAESIDRHRAELIAEAAARFRLWSERADHLFRQGDDLDYVRTIHRAKGPDVEVPEDLKPRLYQQAVNAERTAIRWAERLAKWAGIEDRADGGGDPERAAEVMVERVELFLAAVASVEQRRPT